VDAAAHRGALAAKGRTVAVLGCGLDRTYPPEHQALRKQVESSGAVIAELPLGSFPHGYHFPRRNRIISGMCLGVVVTEAALESGSLITARLAAEQGREVFAVPGFVKADTSRGPNALIKQGAKLVEGIEDILPELFPQLESGFLARLTSCMKPPTARPEPDELEHRVYRCLTWEAIHIDALIEQSGLPAAEVSGLLLGLELKGLLRQLPGHSYVRL
jgi:DNA processing protein